MKDFYITLHFNECWDENIELSLIEATEWLDDLRNTLNDDTLPVSLRLQKVIDEITSNV